MDFTCREDLNKNLKAELKEKGWKERGKKKSKARKGRDDVAS